MKKFNSREFRNLPRMVTEYLSNSRRNDLKINKLDRIDFMAFIYNLDTGRYGSSGFSNKGFLRNIGINTTKSENWVIDIINRIYYGGFEFIEEMKEQTHPKDKNGVEIEIGDIIQIPDYGKSEITKMEYNNLFDKKFYWSTVFRNPNDLPVRLNSFDFSKSEITKKLDESNMLPQF